MQKSERAKKMQENFLVDRQNGMTISEIAKKYQISRNTIYRDLEQIAINHNIKGGRDVLLDEVHQTPAYWERQKREVTESIKVIRKSFNETQKNLSTLKYNVENLTKKMQEEDEYGN